MRHTTILCDTGVSVNDAGMKTRIGEFFSGVPMSLEHKAHNNACPRQADPIAQMHLRGINAIMGACRDLSPLPVMPATDGVRGFGAEIRLRNGGYEWT
jgi:hypothetical protein